MTGKELLVPEPPLYFSQEDVDDQETILLRKLNWWDHFNYELYKQLKQQQWKQS